MADSHPSGSLPTSRSQHNSIEHYVPCLIECQHLRWTSNRNTTKKNQAHRFEISRTIRLVSESTQVTAFRAGYPGPSLRCLHGSRATESETSQCHREDFDKHDHCGRASAMSDGEYKARIVPGTWKVLRSRESCHRLPRAHIYRKTRNSSDNDDLFDVFLELAVDA